MQCDGDSIPISKIDDVLGNNPASDLHTLRYALQYALHCRKNGKTVPNPTYDLNTIFENSQDFDLACTVLSLILQLHDEFEMFEKAHQVADRGEGMKQLKILNSILQVDTPNGVAYISDHLSMDYFNKLIVMEHGKLEENYLSTHIIPKFIQFFGHKLVLEGVWLAALQSNSLQLVGNLSMYFNKSDDFLISQYEEFWLLLQDHLRQGDKIGLYLLHMQIETLKKLPHLNTPNQIVYFSIASKLEYFKALEYFSILLEVSREKQLHLIQPSLGILTNITNKLHHSWIKLIYSILLKHPHSGVVYTTLTIFFQTNWKHSQILYTDVLNALNKSEYTIATKQTLKELYKYTNNLQDDDYEILLESSMVVRWTPVAFWAFYNSVISNQRAIKLDAIYSIIKNAKQLPHKYIRKGCLDTILDYLLHFLSQHKILLQALIDILLELWNDDHQIYARRIINSQNVVVNEKLIPIMTGWLTEAFTNTQKIDLLVEIVNRRDDLPPSWVSDVIHKPFINQTYTYAVLDRLTYVYCIKYAELESYLLQRLNVDEFTYRICHIDKSDPNVITKCRSILTSDSGVNKQALAFEILYYMSESRHRLVYTYWVDKILNKPAKLDPKLAIGFVNLLTKIPNGYILHGVVPFTDILRVYEEFFNTQTSDVAVRIFRSMDLILEHFGIQHRAFGELCVQQLKEMRGCEHYEAAARYFIRSIAIAHEKIERKALEFLMEKLFELSKSSEVIVYYNMLYFKCIYVNDVVFPKYEYLLFGNILGKDERAEYEICRNIYLSSHSFNPYFRPSETNKWVLEDIMIDVNPSRVSNLVNVLIEKYKIHFNKRYFPDSLIHLHKLRIMQTLAFLVPHVVNETRTNLLQLLVDSFCTESHQASVRQLMQYIMIQLLRTDANSLNVISNIIDNVGKTHTSTITGFIPILYGLDLLRSDIDFSMGLVETMLPWTMGAHFKLRLYAQLVISKICDRNCRNRKFKLKYDTLHKSIENVLILTTQIDPSIRQDFELAELIEHERPHTENKKLIYLVSVHIPETTGVTPTEWEYFKIKHAWTKYVKAIRIDTEESATAVPMPVENVQKKMIPWKEILGETESVKSDLIVITSLIESAANLGGLSRTCEIFGVKQMMVRSHKVVMDKEFQSLSMSSEQKLDVVELKVDDIGDFILKAKEKGYKVVGGEQTAESVLLNSYKFEERTILVLGNERAGIPPTLIPLLDVCVEIPQFGVVRSLNVHVAGAMLIWEYVKQHRVSN